MTPELEQLATVRHAAFVEWQAYTEKGQSRVGLYETFCAANRAYVAARDSQTTVQKAA